MLKLKLPLLLCLLCLSLVLGFWPLAFALFLLGSLLTTKRKRASVLRSSATQVAKCGRPMALMLTLCLGLSQFLLYPSLATADDLPSAPQLVSNNIFGAIQSVTPTTTYYRLDFSNYPGIANDATTIALGDLYIKATYWKMDDSNYVTDQRMRDVIPVGKTESFFTHFGSGTITAAQLRSYAGGNDIIVSGYRGGYSNLARMSLIKFNNVATVPAVYDMPDFTSGSFDWTSTSNDVRYDGVTLYEPPAPEEPSGFETTIVASLAEIVTYAMRVILYGLLAGFVIFGVGMLIAIAETVFNETVGRSHFFDWFRE